MTININIDIIIAIAMIIVMCAYMHAFDKLPLENIKLDRINSYLIKKRRKEQRIRFLESKTGLNDKQKERCSKKIEKFKAQIKLIEENISELEKYKKEG